MDKLKTILRNKIVIRSLIIVALTGTGLALSDGQVDQLADVVTMLLGLLG